MTHEDVPFGIDYARLLVHGDVVGETESRGVVNGTLARICVLRATRRSSKCTTRSRTCRLWTRTLMDIASIVPSRVSFSATPHCTSAFAILLRTCCNLNMLARPMLMHIKITMDRTVM